MTSEGSEASVQPSLIRALMHVVALARNSTVFDVEERLPELWTYYVNELAPSFRAIDDLHSAEHHTTADWHSKICAAVQALRADLVIKQGGYSRDADFFEAIAYRLGEDTRLRAWKYRILWSDTMALPSRAGWLQELTAGAQSFRQVLAGAESGDLDDVIARTFAIEYTCYRALGLCLLLTSMLPGCGQGAADHSDRP